MDIVGLSLIVFSIVLVLTKSKILASKREFVVKRYESSSLEGQTPMWIHRWWHAIWTCPMCSGFWISLIVCLIWSSYGYVADVAVVFGLNWLLHCLEKILFEYGEYCENRNST